MCEEWCEVWWAEGWTPDSLLVLWVKYGGFFLYCRIMDENDGNSDRLVFSQSQPISLEGSPQGSQMVSRRKLRPYFKTFMEPGNRFRQPMLPGGPVRQPYSFSVPSPHRLLYNSSTGTLKKEHHVLFCRRN
jgi:hypothetical protein